MLQKWAMKLCRLKGSSSSAERNWSIWGLIQSKLRNRLSMVKGMKLVFIYQNLRYIRMSTGAENYMPFFSQRDTPDGEQLGDMEDSVVMEVLDFWNNFVQVNQEVSANDEQGLAAHEEATTEVEGF